MLLISIKEGDYKANLYEYKYGFGYKIYTKIKGKNTCVARSYAYYNDRNDCYESMINDLNATMGIVKTLFN